MLSTYFSTFLPPWNCSCPSQKFDGESATEDDKFEFHFSISVISLYKTVYYEPALKGM